MTAATELRRLLREAARIGDLLATMEQRCSVPEPELLREIADHIEAGREFRRGEWVTVQPVDGLGTYPLRRGRRKAWVDGVEISREVIARQLRDVADWSQGRTDGN